MVDLEEKGSENAVRHYYNMFNTSLRTEDVLVERDVNRRGCKLQYTCTGCVLQVHVTTLVLDIDIYILSDDIFQIHLSASPLVLRIILNLLVYSMPSCHGNCCSLRLRGTLTVGVATRVFSS